MSDAMQYAIDKFNKFMQEYHKEMAIEKYLKRLPKVQFGDTDLHIKVFKLYQHPNGFVDTMKTMKDWSIQPYNKLEIALSFHRGEELFRKQPGYYPFGYLAKLHLSELNQETLYSVSLKHPKDRWSSKTGLRFLYQDILKKLTDFGYSHSLTKAVRQEIAEKIGLVD